jgi:hypothetical protein
MSTSTKSDAGANGSLLAHGLIVLSAANRLNPPEPIPDAKGSLNHQRLAELAQNNQPPTSWYEGDEEQLF